MPKKLKHVLSKLKMILRSLSHRHYFGFVAGHSYLMKTQIEQIRNRIIQNHRTSAEIIFQFERSFSKLIGNGESISFAAGRMAFYSLMKILEIGKGDQVILQASNCAVMVNAILRIGATPVFADIDVSTMGTDPDSVRNRITPKTKLIIAQHSFGIPCEIDKIAEIAKEYNIFLLEDCALAVGSSFKEVVVGNWGNAALFSIDHTKPINCMIGGLLYLKDKNLYNKIIEYRDTLPSLNTRHQLAIYKQFLFERKYFNPTKYAFGNIIALLIRIIKKKQKVFLTDEYGPPKTDQKAVNYPYPAKLPLFVAQLGQFELIQFKKVKELRNQFLNEYIDIFRKNNKLHFLPKAYLDSKNYIIPLRLIAYFPNDSGAKQFFRNTFEVGSSWFLKPIIACENPEELGYKSGSCINSELSSESIINFPCTFDVKYNNEILKSIDSFLSTI